MTVKLFEWMMTFLSYYGERINNSSFAGVITYINCLSVKLATRIQNFFTAAKLLAIAIIVVGGSIKLMEGK